GRYCYYHHPRECESFLDNAGYPTDRPDCSIALPEHFVGESQLVSMVRIAPRNTYQHRFRALLIAMYFLPLIGFCTIAKKRSWSHEVTISLHSVGTLRF